MSSYNLTNRRKDQAALPLLKSRQSKRRLIEEMEERKSLGLPYNEVRYARR